MKSLVILLPLWGSLFLWGAARAADVETVNVTGTVSIVRKNGSKPGKVDASHVVVWLRPADRSLESRGISQNVARPRMEIRQTHKRFEPHILAVPVGSVVWFPNLDPFFHNVFSLFDGNRFDLGLYEAGASHSVRFDRPGVCFLFCNIHPEMSAVVVVTDGPYAVSDAAGHLAIPNVPPGRYRLHAWHERAGNAAGPATAPEVNISAEHPVLPTISLVDSGGLIAPHKNKYGVDYPTAAPGVIYK